MLRGIECGGVEFLLTRPSRDVTHRHIVVTAMFHISTHTSLAGRDGNIIYNILVFLYFYSHVPRGT